MLSHSFRVALLLAVPAILSAQAPIVHGVVTEAGGTRRLEAVEVMPLPQGTGTLTDVDGTFRLRLGKGVSTLRFRRPGYAALEVAVGLGMQETLAIEMTPVATEIAGLTVLGQGGGALARLPGSGAVITPELLQSVRPLSGNEVLRGIAGVHVQDEEGIGLRTNIGIRGLNPDRSRSVLVLEDGIPVALNPYGEPEMYYTPPVDRMERIEIVKGSGSILHGPQTIGGVINYVTPDPSAVPELRGSALGGGGGFTRAQVTASGRQGNVGALGMATYRRASDLRGLNLEQVDVLLKGTLGLGHRDALGVKLGVYDERSNSTYVGLTDSLFRVDPLAYPGRDDLLAVRRLTASVSHQRELGVGTSLRTVAYGYTTARNWSRQNYGYNASGNGLVFGNGTGNRDRSFEVAGLESRVRAVTAFGEFEGGVRGHLEWARDRHLDGTTATARTGALRDDERRSGSAVAAFAQQHVAVGSRLRITPGLRLEHVRFTRNILRTRVRRTTATGTTNLPEDVDLRTGDAITVLIPGVGASWYAGPSATFFAGAHRGFAPPRTKDAFVLDNAALAAGESVSDPVSLQLDAEKSWNLELGARTRPADGVLLDVTAFALDFTNQIIAPSLSAGSVADAALANQGATRHRGLEAALELDWRTLAGLPFRTGVQYTFVDATFSRDRFLRQGTDTVNVRGNQLPYAPRHLVAMHGELGQRGGLQLRLDGQLIGAQFADNFETRAGSANGRIGEIPAHALWHLSGSVPVPGARAVLMVAVKNLTNRTYIASRRPEGIKPGMPRLVTAGVEWTL